MLKHYINARVFTGSTVLDKAAISTENGVVTGIDPANRVPDAGSTEDLQGLSIAPALIDLQVYGGGGRLFNNEPTVEAIEATWETVRTGGAGFFQITLSCSPLETMWHAIESCRNYLNNGGEGLIGLHLEGPFFNPEKRGAHPLQHVRKPQMADVREIIRRGEGVVTYMTLAPEQFDDESLDVLLRSGIRISAGHSNATYEQAVRGFQKGISRATHLFNAMSPFQSRAPGMVGAIYDFAPWTSIIADGVHCDFSSVRISKKVLGKKLFLISDAVTESLMGDYRFRFSGDRYVDESGVLAGSSLSMWQAVRNCVEKAGISLEEALRMASTYPAMVAGISETAGKIAPGYPVKWVVFDKDLQFVRMI